MLVLVFFVLEDFLDFVGGVLLVEVLGHFLEEN